MHENRETSEMPATKISRRTAGEGSGRTARVRSNGKAIFYIDDSTNVMETEVETKGDSLGVGKTHLLFETKAETFVYQGYPFDVSRDGQKFIINSHAEENSQEITIIANWLAGLKN
jgi:hypothetical protein